MDRGTVQLLLNIVDFKCPLCEEKYRLKYSLRRHLIRSHTDVESDAYLKKILNRL